MPPSPGPGPDDRPLGCLAAEVAEVVRVADRDRWGVGLMAIGWAHLAVFLACQALYARGDRAESHFLALWGLDLAVALTIARRFVGGPGRRPMPALVRVMVRVWATFLILCLTSASLNRLTGFEVDWFKAAWGNLATFGFATMAWIFHPAFLVLAVQMSLTGILIATNPGSAYAIYGASWCLALNGLGLALERRRAPARDRGPGPDGEAVGAQSATFQASR